MKALGETFDIHAGGVDLIFPHHENEIAQARGAGDDFANYWLHNGWVTLAGEKMSKSRGTFIEARTYLNHLDPDYLRYFFATQLGPMLADVDLDMKAFEDRVNSHLVGKWVNIASRCAGFVHKSFGGKLAAQLPASESAAYAAAAQKLSACVALYEARDYAAAMRLVIEVADEANAYGIVDQVLAALQAVDCLIFEQKPHHGQTVVQTHCRPAAPGRNRGWRRHVARRDRAWHGHRQEHA